MVIKKVDCSICGEYTNCTKVKLPNFKKNIWVCAECRYEYGPANKDIAEAYELCNVVFVR